MGGPPRSLRRLRIWVRDHHAGSGWIEATWKHLHRVPVPFGELAWDHASQGLPEATEAEIANAVAALLAKAHAGPGQQAKPKRTARDKRVTARTRAAGPAAPLPRGPGRARARRPAGARRGHRAAGRSDPAGTVQSTRRSMETLVTSAGHIADAAVNTADDQAGFQLTTRQGWRRFTADAPAPPALLSAEKYERLEPLERQIYDENRLDHHARLLRVVARFRRIFRHTVACGRRLVLLNKHAIERRRGLMVSGPAGTGKTIAIASWAGPTNFDAGRHPHATDRIPVVYITVPPAATARMVAAEFARFLGLPVRRSSNITDIIEAVVGVCTDTRTGLVLVDELHNVSLTSRTGAEVADTLKYFSERIPATFIYAGIDIENSNLLSGTRGQQIAGRFTLIPTTPFPYNTEWQGLIATLESTLLLHHPRPAPARPPGPLPARPDRRHDRCPVPRDPRSRDRRHPHRQRSHHQRLSRGHPAGPLRAVPGPQPHQGPPVNHHSNRPLAPLPINVRPRLGETTIHYVQRLARANHLKPSYLLSILTMPSNTKTGRVKLDRLATLSGRTTDVLKNTLADTAPARPTRVYIHTKATIRIEQTASSKARSHGFNIVGQIKEDARRNKGTLRQIADKWGLPRWLIRRILSPHFPERTSARSTLSERLYFQLLVTTNRARRLIRHGTTSSTTRTPGSPVSSLQQRFRLLDLERRTARMDQ
ncbi:hypothetical protein SRIMM317S_06561 [Streptomyces rimosus subsp. rimosus]